MSFAYADTAAGDSWISRCDPRLKLLWLMAMSLASVLVDSTAALALLCAVAVAVALCARWSARSWLIMSGTSLAVVWSTIVSQGMFYAAEPRTPILTLIPAFSLGEMGFSGLRIYREGVIHGFVQSSRLVAVMLAGITVCLSTSPERLLSALTWLRVPGAISFMTVAALRFAPTIVDQWNTVRRAARLRGYRPRLWSIGGGVSASWRMEFALLAPVIAAALRRASVLATSLTVRGFDATAPRTVYPALAMTRPEKGIAALLLAIMVGLATAKTLYWWAQASNYRADYLAPVYEFTSRWL